MRRPILIIEDDISSSKWIKIYLERAGYSAILAHDGISGLKMARHENPALIILDLMLPGLGGMSASRELGDSGVQIIRPLLEMRRSEIIAYCKDAKLEWCEDHTNLDTTYRRNFLRHELLPLIRQRLNSGTDAAVLRLGTLAAQTETYLTAQGQKLLESRQS